MRGNNRSRKQTRERAETGLSKTQVYFNVKGRLQIKTKPCLLAHQGQNEHQTNKQQTSKQTNSESNPRTYTATRQRHRWHGEEEKVRDRSTASDHIAITSLMGLEMTPSNFGADQGKGTDPGFFLPIFDCAKLNTFLNILGE